ncbi:hypothetical protein Plano_1435 [Planococcus sp. PAMC 21323]|uniref:hypothetical protein n=1 Tax=Planococcus sp. PAMC 21323 TaxID=1526927 RepID=UPI000570019D|nr:hypothetical protein [Planococcus sp. PAMC 21323]AIY05400.1 hypothetical protein Plano_1435 [Planococcus sp. PAMC 21323]
MSLFSKFSEANVRKMTNKKLYERLTRLNNEKSPDLKALTLIQAEIAKRNPAEYELGKIEAEVEKSYRHAVIETTDILYLEIKYNKDYLAKPESETDPYERKLRSAKLDMIQKELSRRTNE